jgi:hypothetical protein
MSPTVSLKLTPQEQNVINFLVPKQHCSLEELSQFSKDPTSVKEKTLMKIVSDLKKKFTSAGVAVPFNCQIVKVPPKPAVVEEVRMRKTIGGKLVRLDDHTPDLHIDFQLKKASNLDGSPNNQIKTNNGWVRLNESVFELMELFYNNPGVCFSKEDLKNAMWPQWGSRTPASWWGNLGGRMTSLRTSVPEIKTRLFTIKIGGETNYMMK